LSFILSTKTLGYCKETSIKPNNFKLDKSVCKFLEGRRNRMAITTRFEELTDTFPTLKYY